MLVFKDWLDGHYGMAIKLSKRLSVSRAVISNVKHGRTKLPVQWVPHIIELSRNKLTLQALFEEITAWNKRRDPATGMDPSPGNHHAIPHPPAPLELNPSRLRRP